MELEQFISKLPRCGKNILYYFIFEKDEAKIRNEIIANKSRCTIRTLQRYYKKFIDAGILKVEKFAFHEPNIYKVSDISEEDLQMLRKLLYNI